MESTAMTKIAKYDLCLSELRWINPKMISEKSAEGT